MNLKDCYIAMGGDYDDVMRRFLREDRVNRFLNMFLKDESFDLLCKTLKDENYDGAFRAAHTMKGICMNLGLANLLHACAALTENLRTGKTDEATAGYIEDVKKEYQQTTAAIRSFLA